MLNSIRRRLAFIPGSIKCSMTFRADYPTKLRRLLTARHDGPWPRTRPAAGHSRSGWCCSWRSCWCRNGIPFSLTVNFTFTVELRRCGRLHRTFLLFEPCFTIASVQRSEMEINGSDLAFSFRRVDVQLDFYGNIILFPFQQFSRRYVTVNLSSPTARRDFILFAFFSPDRGKSADESEYDITAKCHRIF